ncbi:hypothetical protein AB9K35_07830 [Leisingera sp. XS_AS12]|uniref:hypothetical protein n=1 Tax=Leisingera sp. XS_AS12 TaxID=3241294 RepID=UPI00351156C7
MLHRTIEIRPLRLYTSYVPADEFDIFVREHGASPASAIAEYLSVMEHHPGMKGIRAAMVLDMQELRDGDHLGGPVDVEGRQIEFLDSWNAFLSGEDSPEIHARITGPIQALIENEAVRLFAPNKTRRGPIRPHHLGHAISLETAVRRLNGVERGLAERLMTGTSGAAFTGYRTAHDGNGLIQVKLEGFKPVLERARNTRNVMTWHALEMRDLSSDPEPAM